MDERPDPGLRLVRADDLRERRIERNSAIYTGLAEREASALIAEHDPVTYDKLHTVVVLAWLKGCMAGYRDGLAMLDRLPASETAPTTEGS